MNDPERPTLRAERLLLRPFTGTDAERTGELAGDREISDTAIRIPYPYFPELARAWIATHQAEWETGRSVSFAITLEGSGELIGAVGLTLDRENRSAELGFWIGRPYWGMGYASEAARAVVRFAFEELALNRVWAYHLVRNEASRRVLEKTGLRHEGTLRQAVYHRGRYEDVAVFARLREGQS